jgi:hypothetical protein
MTEQDNDDDDKKPFFKDIKTDSDLDEEPEEPEHVKDILRRRRMSRSSLLKGGLLPSEFYNEPKVVAGDEIVREEIDELKFRDTLSKKTKRRLEQMSQDYVVASALATLIYYVLGRSMKATIYPVTRDQLKTQEEVDERINDVIKEFSLGPESMEEFQDFIDMVDMNCGLYEYHLPEAMAQAHIFGRSALWIVRANASIMDEPRLVEWGFKEGVPVDTRSWEPKRIAYDGNMGNSPGLGGAIGGVGGNGKGGSSQHEGIEIDISELIYFTRDDYNIIPDSYNYGTSRLVDAIAVSENKRRLTKKVLAEINQNQWAGLNVYEIAGMSGKDMQQFADTLKSGRNKITNQPIKVHSIAPQFDMSGNLEQLKQLTLELLMSMKVPSFLMNYEAVTNRATSQGVAHIWQQTVLEAERNWLRNVLWRYWYKPLMEFFFPDERFLFMKVKVMLEFQSIEFSSLFEKSIAVNNLLASHIISIREAREMLQLPPFPPDQEGMNEDQMALYEQLLKTNPDLAAQLKPAEGQLVPEATKQAMQQKGGGGGGAPQPPGSPEKPAGMVGRIKGKTSPDQIMSRLKRRAVASV